MREIKFRCWNKAHESFRQGCKVISYDGIVGHEYSGGILWQKPEDRNNYVIQQFIGISDINDREVYEGDIIKIHDPKGIVADFIAQICWSKEELSWAFKEGLHWNRPIESMWSWIQDKEIEVIGNIFENPELLKN
jgi:uncharacterized phage protein (TIGR01671 family)